MSHGDVAWTECIRGTFRAPRLSSAEVFGWTYDSFVMEAGYEYVVAKTPEAAVVGMSPVRRRAVEYDAGLLAEHD